VSGEAERLYEQARALNPEARTALVEEACRGNPGLREELLSLLGEADTAEEFFELLGDAVFSTPLLIDQGEVDTTVTSELLPPLARAEPLAGAVIGHYTILSLIGSGGMGSVYRARDALLERDVALKFLPPLSTRLDDEERLLMEARSAAAMEHPNVCTIHEIGQTDDGRPFIAMALHEGETLKDRLQRGPLSLDEAVATGVQIARGLGAAHARGILHRDVKPGNVMLGADGTVRLLDFGLATVTDASRAPSSGTAGTVAYMSPEQARGDPLDPRADLWSLGVVLYEMLAGARPFGGEDDRTLLESILHEDPAPVSQRRPEIPEPLARAVERLLRKDPDARYARAADVLADLESALPSGVGIPRLSRRRAALLAAGITAVVALIGAGLWLPERGAESAPPLSAGRMEPSIAVLPLANLGADPRDAALADGMTEELIAILAKSGGLRVIASPSVFAFKGTQTDVRRIADSLGVSHVLEGDLLKIGSRLRIRVRLVDAGDGSTLWSEAYDREFKDMLSVQGEIARTVARELDLRLAADAGTQLLRRQTQSIAAYELYLRGSDPTLPRSDSGVRESVRYYRQAIMADSTYAAAHAGLALAYVRLGSARDPDHPLHELYALAEEAAGKAIALDDSLAEAHLALGRARMAALDFGSAQTELERAIALDPTDWRFRGLLATLHIWAERPLDALTEARRALEVDPLSPYSNVWLAHALFVNRRCDEALAQLERLAAIRPPLRSAAAITGQCHARKRMWPEAIAALRPQAEAGDPLITALLGHTLARAGQREEARRILADLLARRSRTGSGAFEVAVVYAGLGDVDQAFTWLDRSIGDLSLKAHIMEPTFEDLQSDPRFERLRTRLGLQKL
jgi:serine/threonine-protein kinase